MGETYTPGYLLKMKPKEKLAEMKKTLYEVTELDTPYNWVGDEKDSVTIDTPFGETDILLHYDRNKITSKKKHNESLKHKLNGRFNAKRNVANLFYGDGETFLQNEGNRLLELGWPQARAKWSGKEIFILDNQRSMKTLGEKLAFKKNLSMGQFPPAHLADTLSYIIPREFGGNMKTYAMQPELQNYRSILPGDRRYDFVGEGFSKTKGIARQVAPSKTSFELLPLKKGGRLMVFRPR